MRMSNAALDIALVCDIILINCFIQHVAYQVDL